MTDSDTILHEIASDNLSGASAIYTKAIAFFSAILHENAGAVARELRNLLHTAGRELIAAQPEMAPLYNLVSSIIKCADSAAETDNLQRTLSTLMITLASEEEQAVTEAAERAASLIDTNSVVLTISYSSAVRETLLRHHRADSLKVIVPESRPMCEGARLAADLSDRGLEPVLIADLAFWSHLDEIDYFICGADAVTENFIVNKIGTAAMSGEVKDIGGCSIAVFSENKVLPSDVYKFSPGNHPALELIDLPNPKYRVENRYFEKAPSENFSRFVTNRSVYDPATLSETIRENWYPFDLG